MIIMNENSCRFMSTSKEFRHIMSLKTDLNDLVVPLESSYSLPVDTLIRLEAVLCDRDEELTLVQWIDIASSVTNLPDSLLRIIFELCEVFFRTKNLIKSSFLVFSLFLQNSASTRKHRLGEKKKRTNEESLKEFFQLNFRNLCHIFSQKSRLNEVMTMAINDYQPDLDPSQLTNDPHGVISCIKSGKSLTWRLGNPMTSKLAKMATTAHKADPGGRKRIVLSRLVRQTVLKNSSTVRGSSVLVHRSKQSQIYLPTQLRSVDIVKTRSSLVVTGPVRRTLRVTGARHLTIVSVARRVIIQDCVDCTFYILTPSAPLLSSSCHNITFAPYNCNYQGFTEDIKHARLDQKSLNLWKSPEIVSSKPALLLPQPFSNIFSILDAKDFDKVCFPLNIEASKFHPTVPMSYIDASHVKTSQVEKWDSAVIEAELSLHQEEILNSLIENDFNRFIKQHHDIISSNINSLNSS